MGFFIDMGFHPGACSCASLPLRRGLFMRVQSVRDEGAVCEGVCARACGCGWSKGGRRCFGANEKDNFVISGRETTSKSCV
jgi:hypothetical protein